MPPTWLGGAARRLRIVIEPLEVLSSILVLRRLPIPMGNGLSLINSVLV